MRLSNLAHLYVVRLRTRLVAELLAVAGIAVGVALVFAALVANASLTGAMQELMRGIVGDATLQVSARGPQGFDQRLLRQVRQIDGVQVAAPVLEVRANLVGPRGRRSVLLVGGEAQLARLGGRLVNGLSATGASSLDALRGQRIVAVPEPIATELGIRLGSPIEVETDTRSVRVPLGVRLHESDVGALVNSPAALAPLDYVQRLSGAKGRITRIFVKAGPGREASVADALRELAAGRLNVRPADADVEVFEQAAYPTKQSTTLFSALSALVGFLFAFSAVLLTVPHRRNLIADLQMAGYPPTAVLQALLFDAIVLGTVGALVGLGLGDQVSRHMFDDVPDYLSFTFSIGALRTVTWPSVLIAAGAGLAAACLAVLVPLRDVLSHSPLLRPLPPRRYDPTTWMTVGGLACLAAATVIVVAAPALASLGLVALTMALVLVLAPLLRVGTSVFSALTRRAVTPAPPLAALEMRSHASQLRTLAVAATGALALFATVSIAGARADLQRGLDASTRDTVGNADVWITFPDAPNVLATTPFTDAEAIAKDLDDLRDVEAVRVYRGSLLDVADHRAWVLAPPSQAPQPVPQTQLRVGDAERATDRLREGGWVVLSEAIADAEGVGVGDPVTLPTPVPTTLRVAALSTNLGWSPGSILLNADDYARAWGTRAASALQVELAPGASPDVAKRRIEQAVGMDVPLQVETLRERTTRHYQASRDGLARLTQISILVIAAAVLAMATAMAGMIWQRRPTLARLKVQGFSARTLWRALLIESAVLLGSGCMLGAAFGLYGQVLLSRALETITGFPVSYSAAATPAAAVLALVTAVVLVMLALPGWLAVRVRPAPGTTS
jgi:putative ABC transport system permease protein